jgi:hypothetical protein
MLAGNLVRAIVNVSADVEEDIKGDVIPQCACGHQGCGDSAVSAHTH